MLLGVGDYLGRYPDLHQRSVGTFGRGISRIPPEAAVTAASKSLDAELAALAALHDTPAGTVRVSARVSVRRVRAGSAPAFAVPAFAVPAFAGPVDARRYHSRPGTDRRDAGTPGRRDAGTPGRRDAEGLRD